MSPAPQFGDPEPGCDYPDRPAAFAIVERDGRIACVRVAWRRGGPKIDLPGGGLDPGESAQRVERIGALVDELVAQRAEERIGESVEVLLEGVDPAGPPWGRAEHQGPDVDGVTRITGMIGGMPGRAVPQVGDLVRVSVLAGDGADLVAGMPPAAVGEGVA